LAKSCASRSPGPDICPSEDDLRPQIFALLPPGRAFQTHDGGPWPRSVLYGFWDAVAQMRAWFNRRMCDLRAEFFCATAVETTDLWMRQYGLPNPCDEYLDLCEKVAAQPSLTCSWFVRVAMIHGWAIECLGPCAQQFGAARFRAGIQATADERPRFGVQRFGKKLGCAGSSAPEFYGGFGAWDPETQTILVRLSASPAYGGVASHVLRFGAGRFGQRLACDFVDITALKCLIEQIAPAETEILYQTV